MNLGTQVRRNVNKFYNKIIQIFISYLRRLFSTLFLVCWALFILRNNDNLSFFQCLTEPLILLPLFNIKQCNAFNSMFGLLSGHLVRLVSSCMSIAIFQMEGLKLVRAESFFSVFLNAFLGKKIVAFIFPTRKS